MICYIILFGISPMNLELKLLMTRLSDFLYHGLVHVMSWIWRILFVGVVFFINYFLERN